MYADRKGSSCLSAPVYGGNYGRTAFHLPTERVCTGIRKHTFRQNNPSFIQPSGSLSTISQLLCSDRQFLREITSPYTYISVSTIQIAFTLPTTQRLDLAPSSFGKSNRLLCIWATKASDLANNLFFPSDHPVKQMVNNMRYSIVDIGYRIFLRIITKLFLYVLYIYYCRYSYGSSLSCSRHDKRPSDCPTVFQPKETRTV